MRAAAKAMASRTSGEAWAAPAAISSAVTRMVSSVSSTPSKRLVKLSTAFRPSACTASSTLRAAASTFSGAPRRSSRKALKAAGKAGRRS
jgi:hypothetical protein